MVNFKDTNAFSDPEDSKLVADAKKIIPDPVPYNYTEVCRIRLVALDI
jgi:multifunctional beta-oxidation protein